jgi:hypothetical protein
VAEIDAGHAHIVVRGIAGDGSDLVMRREFTVREMRRIAQDLATRHLGEMRQRELGRHRERQAEWHEGETISLRSRGKAGNAEGPPVVIWWASLSWLQTQVWERCLSGRCVSRPRSSNRRAISWAVCSRAAMWSMPFRLICEYVFSALSATQAAS